MVAEGRGGASGPVWDNLSGLPDSVMDVFAAGCDLNGLGLTEAEIDKLNEWAVRAEQLKAWCQSRRRAAGSASSGA